MFETRRIVPVAVAAILALAACGMALEFPKIDRRPAVADWERGKLASVAHFDPNSAKPFQVDLRCYDLSDLDLKDRVADLLRADFDDRTTWPPAERMPKDFNARQIMELGKNPGLGVRALHKQGVTGRGVGIAIVDQPLIVDHQEYADRLRLYEEINIQKDSASEMHGPAVASIAVGKTVGVAPEADLYYIAEFNGDVNNGNFTWNFEYLARGVQRILEINEQLPPDRKIRVISMSIGWGPSQKGYQKITEAAQKAKAAGMLVICSSVEQVHGFAFHGLGRPPTANPDDFSIYEPGSFWAQDYYKGGAFYSKPNRLLVPMDSRTTASPTGKTEYVFYAEGGWSWSIPYIAGAYALAAQVEPKITPERFWALALKTGRTIKLRHQGKEHDFGPILDPARLVEAIRRGDLADAAAATAELAKYYRPIPTVAQGPVPKELAARLDALDIDKATRKAVIEQLGKPSFYALGNDVLDPNKLPNRYAMVYPGSIHVVIMDDRVLRIAILSPGYLFRGKVQVGSSLDEVLAVLGPPRKTVEGTKIQDIMASQEDDVLYKNLDGVEGTCAYQARAKGVMVGLNDGRVSTLVLLPKSQPGNQ
jgi:hypothetical protein